MTATTRRKTSRQRGTHTHGWGSKKKHRGAGSRGGKGMAGTGKRGDVKKPSIWKNLKYFGKHGFKKKNIAAKINAINMKTIEQCVAGWIASKKAEEKDGMIVIDLAKVGYNKLLSNGNITKKLKIITPYASTASIEKVKAAGGIVEGLVEKKVKPKTDKDKKE